VKNRDINSKPCSKIMMTLTSSKGTWLNGCLQPQHYFVHLNIKDPQGNSVANVGLSFEQASKMLLYNGEVDCTLQQYRDTTGKLVEEKVIPPETVKQRMKKRLAEVEASLINRIEDIKSDLYSMINGHTKPGKVNLEEMMSNINTVLSHLTSNREFVVQETERELSAMQSNMAGQLGLLIQANTGVQLPEEALKKLLPVADGPLLIGSSIDPIIDNYEPKEHQPVPIEDMTAMEVADAIKERLSFIEARIPRNEKNSKLYFSGASQTTKGKVSIHYVNFQGSSVIELDMAKEYLKFLISIERVSEFKEHYYLENK
jgi:hypothetical protein